MGPGQARISLSELQRKTDRQLVALVCNQIESSLRLARRGAMEEAEALWKQARNLLAVAHAPEGERIALEARLNEARARFLRPRTSTTGFVQSACC
jgi:alpha-D-ribose 1-methylphosphonate 5-triphosphate synthase subunit PhnI